MARIQPRPASALLALGLFGASASCGGLFVSDEYRSLNTKRRFTLDYEVTLPPAVNEQLGAVRVWVPVPVSDGVQTIDILEAPEGARWSAPDVHGNRFCSVLWQGGERTLQWKYRVERREDIGNSNGADRRLEQKEVFLHYLDPDMMVPARGPAAEVAFELGEEFERKDLPAAIYRTVVDSMEYREDRDTGYGSSDFAAVEGYGVAIDYASYFIGALRYHQIAARAQLGFLLPSERGAGELTTPHAWAHWYRPEDGWFPVDAAAADLDPNLDSFYFGELGSNRVSFSCGRDLVLDPPQEGAPLNYFVVAYAEQDGREVRVDTVLRYFDL